MKRNQPIEGWVAAFNRRDADALAAFYAADAVNHQVAEEPVRGRDAIRAMFAAACAAAASSTSATAASSSSGAIGTNSPSSGSTASR